MLVVECGAVSGGAAVCLEPCDALFDCRLNAMVRGEEGSSSAQWCLLSTPSPRSSDTMAMRRSTKRSRTDNEHKEEGGHSNQLGWYTGVVDKVCGSVVEVYYEDEDKFACHDTAVWNIERTTLWNNGTKHEI